MFMERLHVVVSAGLALALAAMPGYSHAQSTGSTPEGARTDTANDETIVVTGSLVELDNQQLVADGVRHALAPGMQASAEIALGTRSVLEYLLSPVRAAWHEAARER